MKGLLREMDGILADAREADKKPLHWTLMQDDWLAIGREFRRNRMLVEDPTTVGTNTYRGIPVHFGTIGGKRVVLHSQGDPVPD